MEQRQTIEEKCKEANGEAEQNCGGRGRGPARGRGRGRAAFKRPAAAPVEKVFEGVTSAGDAQTSKASQHAEKDRSPSEADEAEPSKKQKKARAEKPSQKAKPDTEGATETPEPKAKKRKTKAAKEKKTFARRYLPDSEEGRAKWNGLRQIYEAEVAPKLLRPSKFEDWGI